MAYLSMVWQQQQQSSWCWAACTSMVCQFYVPTVFPTQCSVATITINTDRLLNGQTEHRLLRSECGIDDGEHYWWLLPPLALTGHFASFVWASLTFRRSGTTIVRPRAPRLRSNCLEWWWRPFHCGKWLRRDFAPFGDIVYIEDPAYGPTTCGYLTWCTTIREVAPGKEHSARVRVYPTEDDGGFSCLH